jgi:hypothetical protein
VSRARARNRAHVSSAGPDAVHLCLTVRGRPHVWGCAWASYGEARPVAPRSSGSRVAILRVGRARPLPLGPAPDDASPPDPAARK